MDEGRSALAPPQRVVPAQWKARKLRSAIVESYGDYSDATERLLAPFREARAGRPPRPPVPARRAAIASPAGLLSLHRVAVSNRKICRPWLTDQPHSRL